jgi:hypothetical protein
MEAVTLGQTLAGLGAIGVLTAGLNVVALRLVRVDEVPGCVRARIRWWSAHNPAFLLISAVVAAVGLTTLATAAL